MLLHHRLDRQSGGNLQRHAGIVALALAWPALHHRLDLGVAGNLRHAAQIVLVAAQGDQGAALAPSRSPGGGNAGDAFGDIEAVLGQDVGDISAGAEFLEARFAIAEHRIHHHLDHLGVAVDVGDGLLLIVLGRQRRGWQRRQNRSAEQKSQEFSGGGHGHLRFPIGRKLGEISEEPPPHPFLAEHEQTALAAHPSMWSSRKRYGWRTAMRTKMVLAAACLSILLTAQAQAAKLLVISVDGLDWRYLRDRDALGLKIPNLRKLMAKSQIADGVVGVWP